MTLLLLAVAAPAGMTMAGEQSHPYIVVFKDDAVAKQVSETQVYLVRRPTTTATASTPKREVDGTRVRKHVSEVQARMRIRVDNVFDNALGGFSANLTPGQLRALENDPAVESVVPDDDVALDDMTATDYEAGGVRSTANPRASVPAGVRRVGAQRNAVARLDGRDTRVNADVAIIDTGVERDHPDLNVVGGYNCTSNNRGRWDDVDGHGTHVAGIVGALDNRFGVVGVAPGARIWSVKVLGPHGTGRMSWLICGVDWVTAQRDKHNPKRPLFEVANMSISFGGRKDSDCGRNSRDTFHQAVCRSVARGTVYVVAAGNESHNARLNRPASYDEVITVSAMADYDGRGGGRGRSSDSCPYWSPEKDDSFTTFSNYGADVDLIAPGRCVLSTYKHKRYAWMSGTSMATPHVTGAVAVYRAMFPRATPHQVRLALQAVATRDWRTGTDPDRTNEKAVWIGGFRQMPDFSTAAGAGAASVVAGGELQLDVTVNRMGGFVEPVSVALDETASGISATTTSTSGASATLSVKVGSRVPAGTYVLVVRSTSWDIERASVVTIDVRNLPDGESFEAGTGQ
jgi:subtilisin